jgi:hypothetical protein
MHFKVSKLEIVFELDKIFNNFSALLTTWNTIIECDSEPINFIATTNCSPDAENEIAITKK